MAAGDHGRRYPVLKKSTIADALDGLGSHRVRGDLVCTQCGRVAGTVEGSNDPRATSITIRVQDPHHADAARRLCCPFCSARLWLQNSAAVRDEWHALDTEALR